MNTERPSYSKRNFYGPLELAADFSQIEGRYVLKHPDDPTKLVRVGAEGTYFDQLEMDTNIYQTQQVLNSLRKYGINHVNPSYINETAKDNEPNFIIVVDKLTQAQAYSELRKQAFLTEEQTNEIDHAITEMLRYVEQAMHTDGFIDPEMIHLDQFAYDESQSAGNKMILVDVEPIGSSKIDMTEDSMKYGYPSPLCRTVTQLSIDAINLANQSSRNVSSLEKATQVVEALPGDSQATFAAKSALLQALITQEVTPQVKALALPDDEE